MLFADLLSLHLVTFLMFFILVHVSRCMLELKFGIYYRAASLPSQASYAVLAEASQAFFKHSPLGLCDNGKTYIMIIALIITITII